MVDGVQDGQLTNMVTDVDIHLQRCNGGLPTNYFGPGADVRQIVVRLKFVSPLGPADVIEETFWEKTFRPANLWRQWKQEDGC